MDLVYSGELLLNLQELFSDQPSLSCQKKLICYYSHITIPRHTSQNSIAAGNLE